MSTETSISEGASPGANATISTDSSVLPMLTGGKAPTRVARRLAGKPAKRWAMCFCRRSNSSSRSVSKNSSLMIGSWLRGRHGGRTGLRAPVRPPASQARRHTNRNTQRVNRDCLSDTQNSTENRNFKRQSNILAA
ncbi:hypothetical protein DO73_4744 [Burkholderia pseudomallei]|nr:hypothetical protein DO73_4744 [Burkholderia pseudomallei]